MDATRIGRRKLNTRRNMSWSAAVGCATALLWISGCETTASEASTGVEPAPPTLVRFHVAQEQTQEGFRELQDEQGVALFLEPTAALTEDHIASAALLSSGTQHIIQVEFSGLGAQLLERTTASHPGSRLAILVNDKLVAAPRIMGTVPNGQVNIIGNFTREQAREIAFALNP